MYSHPASGSLSSAEHPSCIHSPGSGSPVLPTTTLPPMAKDNGVEHPVADQEEISGNASPELKRQMVELWPFSKVDPDHFASSIGGRLEFVEISVVPKREDPQVMEGRVVSEIDVVPGVFQLPFKRSSVSGWCVKLTRFTHKG